MLMVTEPVSLTAWLTKKMKYPWPLNQMLWFEFIVYFTCSYLWEVDFSFILKMRLGETIEPTKSVRGAPSLESDPLYSTIKSIHERLIRFLRGKFYTEPKFLPNLLRVLDELYEASHTISFLLVRHFKLRLVIMNVHFKVQDLSVRARCKELLNFWTSIEDNMLPRNWRYCGHQIINIRDWYLGTLEATVIPTRPAPPYRPMGYPDRKRVYVDLWYHKHRLQLYGGLTIERFRQMLAFGPVWAPQKDHWFDFLFECFLNLFVHFSFYCLKNCRRKNMNETGGGEIECVILVL